MSRETRMILLLVAISLVGVVALGGMAQRYARILDRDDDGGAVAKNDADRHVEDFVRVRSALVAVIEEGTFEAMDPSAKGLAFAARRDQELASVGIDAADYRSVRGHFRRWSTAPARLDPAWRAVLGRHEQALRSCSLGDWEELDR